MPKSPQALSGHKSRKIQKSFSLRYSKMTEQTELGTIVTPKIPVALEDYAKYSGILDKESAYLYQKTEEGSWL